MSLGLVLITAPYNIIGTPSDTREGKIELQEKGTQRKIQPVASLFLLNPFLPYHFL